MFALPCFLVVPSSFLLPDFGDRNRIPDWLAQEGGPRQRGETQLGVATYNQRCKTTLNGKYIPGRSCQDSRLFYYSSKRQVTLS